MQENETKLEMKIKLSPWRRTSRWEARRQSSSYSWDIACKPSSARIALCVIFKSNLQKPFWNLNLLLTVGCFGFGGAPIPCLSLHIGHGLSQELMRISILLLSIIYFEIIIWMGCVNFNTNLNSLVCRYRTEVSKSPTFNKFINTRL